MKTEKEISDRLKFYMASGSKTKQDEKILFAQIELLMWVLKCPDCHKVDCSCYDPF